MVTIEAYRARIGTYQATKVRQRNNDSFPFKRAVPDDNYKASSTSKNLKLSNVRFGNLFAFIYTMVLLSNMTLSLTEKRHCGKTYKNNTHEPVFSSPLESKHVGALPLFFFSNTYAVKQMENVQLSVVHAEVLAIKLIIGNVEKNPGPQNLKEFLAFLFLDTEDARVKDVLNDFKASQNEINNLKKMKTKKVENLKATLAYLNDWKGEEHIIKEEIDAYTKDGLAQLVVKKIYNMAPDVCKSCNKSYSFKPGEYCVLSCIRCGRGACKDCYERDKNVWKESIMFNKCIFFSCGSCEEIVRKENNMDEHLKKKHKKGKSQIPITLDDSADFDELSDKMKNLSVQSQVPKETSSQEENGSVERAECEANSEEHNSVLSSLRESKEGDSVSDLVSENAEKQLKNVDNKTNDGTKAKKRKDIQCKYYAKNVCKHGISGKNCSFYHQKPCSKLLQTGQCKKGKQCSFFHPLMCKFSLKHRACSNLECEFMHVKGTRRENVSNKTTVTDVKKSGLNKKKKGSTKTITDKSKYRNENNVENNCNAEGILGTTSKDKETNDFLEKSQRTGKPPFLIEETDQKQAELINLLSTLVQTLQQQVQPNTAHLQIQPFWYQPQTLQRMI